MALFQSRRDVKQQPQVITESIPEEMWYWAAIVSILLSLMLKLAGKDSMSLFIGQWPPTFLIMGLYRRLSK